MGNPPEEGRCPTWLGERYSVQGRACGPADAGGRQHVRDVACQIHRSRRGPPPRCRCSLDALSKSRPPGHTLSRSFATQSPLNQVTGAAPSCVSPFAPSRRIDGKEGVGKMKLDELPAPGALIRSVDKAVRADFLKRRAEEPSTSQAGLPSVPYGIRLTGSKKHGIRGVRRNAPPYPTIPITITLGRVYDHQLGEMHEETILWPLGDSSVSPAAVAVALCKQLNLGSPDMIGQVQNQIEYALRKFGGYQPRKEPQPLEIAIDVALDGHEFRDTVTWYPFDPLPLINDFAKQTCDDLGLPTEMAGMIASQMRAKCEAFLASAAKSHQGASKAA